MYYKVLYNMQHLSICIATCSYLCPDLCTPSPLASYFNASLFQLTGPKQVWLHEPYRGDSDDPLDTAYLRETGVRARAENGSGMVLRGSIVAWSGWRRCGMFH